MKNNKGQGLPMNTIIIAILVLVVLVVIIAFFVGGTSTVVSKITGIFGGATAGEDVSLARQFCQSYCDKAQDTDPAYQSNTAYCTKSFKIDGPDNDEVADKFTDGENEGKYQRFYCDQNNHKFDELAGENNLIGVGCGGVQCV